MQLAQDSSWTQKSFTVKEWQQWTLADCYVDAPGSRALNVTLYQGNKTSTVEGCLDSCAKRGLAFCAPSYGGECYGSVIAPKSTVAPTAGNTDPIARGCNMPCLGNSTEYCGGTSRITVYNFAAGKSPVNPATTLLISPSP